METILGGRAGKHVNPALVCGTEIYLPGDIPFFDNRYHRIESAVGWNVFLRIGQKLLPLRIARKTVNKTLMNHGPTRIALHPMPVQA